MIRYREDDVPLGEGEPPPIRRPRAGGKNGGDRLSRAAQAEAVERQAKVVALRLRGKTFAAIAAELGYADHAGAREAYKRARELYIAAPTREAWELELARLDALTNAVWDKALADKPFAQQRYLEISRQRSRLYGYDGMFSVDDEGDLSERQEVERLVAELRGFLTGEPGTPPA